MTIKTLGWPRLEIIEMLRFHTFLPSYDNQQSDRSQNSKKCYHFIYIRQAMGIKMLAPAIPNKSELFYFIQINEIMKIETLGRTKLELQDMLLFHTYSRNYENQEHWARPQNSKKCYHFIHDRQIMTIKKAELPQLDL